MATKPKKVLLTLTLALFILSAFVISGFTLVDRRDGQAANSFLFQNLTNPILNGDFEQNPTSSVATYWQPYDNGQSHFGWYDEKWPEAVHSGQHSQLLEIYQVQAPERVIGIHQTVNVVPGMIYSLTMFAMMRTDAPVELRNKGQYSMQWGVDYSGQGKDYLVQTWVPMTLTEQLRIGSNTVSNDEPVRLVFELITGTIFTANSSRITLFIRGVQHEVTGTEVNFNIDDVSLLGPYPPPPTPTSTPTASPTFPPLPTFTPTATPSPTPTTTPLPTPVAVIPPLPITGDPAAPASEQKNLPSAGAIMPKDIPLSAVMLGGIVLAGLGVSAVRSLWRHRSGR